MNLKTSRRKLLAQIAAGAAVAQMPLMGMAQTKKIKIGFVSPQTGVLAAFGETDRWALNSLKDQLAKGVTINGAHYAVEVLHLSLIHI